MPDRWTFYIAFIDIKLLLVSLWLHAGLWLLLSISNLDPWGQTENNPQTQQHHSENTWIDNSNYTFNTFCPVTCIFDSISRYRAASSGPFTDYRGSMLSHNSSARSINREYALQWLLKSSAVFFMDACRTISDQQLTTDISRYYETWKQQSRQQNAHMKSRNSYGFSGRAPQPHRKGPLHRRMRLSWPQHTDILRIFVVGISNKSPLAPRTWFIYLMHVSTYTVACTTSNVEGLAFGGTRITHQNDSGNCN